MKVIKSDHAHPGQPWSGAYTCIGTDYDRGCGAILMVEDRDLLAITAPDLRSADGGLLTWRCCECGTTNHLQAIDVPLEIIGGLPRERALTSKIVRKLPAIGTRKDYPTTLIGATITDLGSFPEGQEPAGVEGGLVIDYRTTGGESRRVVFNFTEEGMWVKLDYRFPADQPTVS